MHTILLSLLLGTAVQGPAKTDATLVLAGGCFWGTEAVFEHLLGVTSVTSVYALPKPQAGAPDATVPIESVRITYEPARINLKQLLEVFFAVAHDPTTRDVQGPDAGPEYRTMVFYEGTGDRDVANAYVRELTAAKRFAKPIVTEVRELKSFVRAEAFHQDYGFHHPKEPYIVYNDAPKLVKLKQEFPALYTDRRAP